MKHTNKYMGKVVDMWTCNRLSYSGDASLKPKMHNQVANILRDFAVNVLGLQANQFEVRSNKGGIAVTGEVTLHTDAVQPDGKGIYIQISQNPYCHATHPSVLYRTCNGMTDFTGGKNYYYMMRECFSSRQSMWRFEERIMDITTNPAFRVVA